MTKSSAKIILQAQGLKKEYLDGTRKLTVLDGTDLTVRSGEFISIVGHSGSGKSTLLHLLGTLDRPTSGTITLNGEDYSKMSDRNLASLRSQQIGFVYQFHHLLPEFTALENILLPGLIARAPQAATVAKAEALLARVGLTDRKDHRPTKLSGGEQQRVALARALLNSPSLVLADEPTGNLDSKTAGEVLEFLIKITTEEGKSLVMVTHDEEIAKRANHHFLLEDGRLKRQG
jgi:lipoprotein-releasing system ATP-binding protein